MPPTRYERASRPAALARESWQRGVIRALEREERRLALKPALDGLQRRSDRARDQITKHAETIDAALRALAGWLPSVGPPDYFQRREGHCAVIRAHLGGLTELGELLPKRAPARPRGDGQFPATLEAIARRHGVTLHAVASFAVQHLPVDVRQILFPRQVGNPRFEARALAARMRTSRRKARRK